MLVRKTRLKHYGIDKELAKWLRNQATLSENEKLLRFAAEQSNIGIADRLVESFTCRVSYERLAREKGVYISRNDFYAYRGLTTYIFWLLLTGRELDQEK